MVKQNYFKIDINNMVQKSSHIQNMAFQGTYILKLVVENGAQVNRNGNNKIWKKKKKINFSFKV